MKKIIAAMALLAMVASVQAVSFSWGLGSDKVSYDGSVTTSGVNCYLVYMGESVSSWTDAMFDGSLASPNAVVGEKVSSGTPAPAGPPAGTFKTEFDKSLGTQFANDTTYGLNSSFGMIITYTIGDKTYYNISDDIFNLPAGTTDISTGVSTSFGFNWGSNEEGNFDSSAVGAGWTPVPEPATAALAIAGLAMLIRRRK